MENNKILATVFVENATDRAKELGFKSNEVYRCEFLEKNWEHDGFDTVESRPGVWIPISSLIRSGATICYKINENQNGTAD